MSVAEIVRSAVARLQGEYADQEGVIEAIKVAFGVDKDQGTFALNAQALQSLIAADSGPSHANPYFRPAVEMAGALGQSLGDESFTRDPLVVKLMLAGALGGAGAMSWESLRQIVLQNGDEDGNMATLADLLSATSEHLLRLSRKVVNETVPASIRQMRPDTKTGYLETLLPDELVLIQGGSVSLRSLGLSSYPVDSRQAYFVEYAPPRVTGHVSEMVFRRRFLWVEGRRGFVPARHLTRSERATFPNGLYVNDFEKTGSFIPYPSAWLNPGMSR